MSIHDMTGISLYVFVNVQWLKFFFLMPVIMDCLVLAIWPPPAYNIIRSYIPEDTLCFSFFLCLCEVMVSKLGCNYISGIINGIAYMFLYAFNE